MITKCNLLANTLFYQTKKKEYKEIVIFHNEEVNFNVLKIYMSPLVIKLFPIDTKFIIFN
jgi:hypothetical protein